MADDGLDITVEGIPQFEAMMKDLGEGNAIEQVKRKAMRSGGRIIQAAITDAAPVRPALPSGTALPVGALKADIELHVTKESDGSISAYIEPGKLTRHVASWVEEGHILVKGGRKGKGKVIGHVPPHPFIRNSADASEASAIAAIEQTLATELNEAAAVRGAREA